VTADRPTENVRSSPWSLRRTCAALVACGLLLAAAPAAQAGPPVHLPLSNLDITGLNHACGTAVDSQGEVYVSSAGDSKIFVFDPEQHQPGEQIAEISNSSEPCGLAVDSKGNLYVSEQKPGEVKVVKYHPTEYPFTGPPSYEPPVTIDPSEEAKGITVDPVDDRLYVAEGDHIAVFRSDGTFDAFNEVEKVLVSATSGTYTLSFQGQTTAPLAYNATSAEVQVALEALSTIGSGNVSVTSGGGGFAGNHDVTFQGVLADTNVSQLTGDGSGLTGGFGLSISTPTQGFSGRIGDGELTEATGVAAYTYQPDSERIRFHLFAADAVSDTVTVFSGDALASLSLRKTIDGSDEDAFKADKTPDNGLGFGPSGTALAADWASGHVLVYDDQHQVVDEFEAGGEYLSQISSADFADAEPTGIAAFPERDEVQRLDTNCEGGSFILSFEGQPTASLPCAATASEIQLALEALPTVGAGNVAVSGRRVGLAANYAVAFVEDLGSRDLDQLLADGSGLTGVNSQASVSTDAQGSGPGRVYVTAGAGTGAALLAFGPLAPPGRSPLPEGDSFSLKGARSVAVDIYGNRYVGADTQIGIYPPGSAEPLLKIEDPGRPIDIAVDSECNLYVLDKNPNLGNHQETVRYFTPSSCPPTPATTYTVHAPILKVSDFKVSEFLNSIAINPATDRLYVTNLDQTQKLDSAKEGSAVLDPDWAGGLVSAPRQDIDVCAADDTVYLADHFTTVYVLNSAGTEVLDRITGRGGPGGTFDLDTKIAVDQANCHLLTFNSHRGVAEEFDASGAFVAQFGSTSTESINEFRVAVDSSCALHDPPLTGAACEAFDPAYADAYIAFDDPENKTHPFDLDAFAPLSYGEPPATKTGLASELAGGEATLNGTVDPRGFEVQTCEFEYLSDAAYQANGFTGATAVPCAETSEEIGMGTKPVPVHARIAGLDPEGRYRFRLIATNKYGKCEKCQQEAGLFGPPEAETKSAQPVLYTEATLRAEVEPSGLPTTYRFEYGKTEAYGQSTPTTEIAAAAEPTEVAAPVFELGEGETYHFRVVVENEAKSVKGADETLTTLQRLPSPSCPNDEYRTGFSAQLPDCRAYELVTPADTGGLTPDAASGEVSHLFDSWPVAPSGAGAGERITYFTNGTLPGFDGNGLADGYRAVRGDGPHPQGGWQSELFSPTYSDAAVDLAHGLSPEGVSPDQEYSLWRTPAGEGALEPGTHLRTPAGFQTLGQGSLGTDPNAESHYVSPGGTHVIFSSKAHLELATPLASANTDAIYDRGAGSSSAHVVSLKPGSVAFGAGKDATFVGSTEDGRVVAFEVGGVLYLRQDDETTIQVANAPNTFAGISADGKRVFYVGAAVGGPNPEAAVLWMFDTDMATATEIAPESRFVNVSADGSRVYFASAHVFDDAHEGVSDERNLYVWDAATEATRFVAVLDRKDFDESESFGEEFFGDTDNLIRWPDAVSWPHLGGFRGRGLSPTRTTPDGSVLVFESYTRLTLYDNTEASASACGDPEEASDSCLEIYQYDDAAAAGERLTCLSCDPTGARPTGDSNLQQLATGTLAAKNLLIPNLTADGQRVFFQTEDALIPEDANEAADVYEWLAQGAGGCARIGGCLALISSGQGEIDNILYGMTPDGHDVFFVTSDRLYDADIAGSPSIYDAREGGGIPEPPVEKVCSGDACQPTGSAAPALPSPTTTGSGGGNVPPRHRRHCAKGKHRVKGRCVSRHRRPSRHAAKHHERGKR
jgi:hypothetical protein